MDDLDDEFVRRYLAGESPGGSMGAIAQRMDADQLWNWSLTRTWAFDEMQRRVRECEAFPRGDLGTWAKLVAGGKLQRPHNEGKPGRPRKATSDPDRDIRIAAAVQGLIGEGRTKADVFRIVARHACLEPRSIREVWKRVMADHPFK